MMESLEQTGNADSSGERILIEAPPGLPRQLVVGYLGRCRENAREAQAAVKRGDYGKAEVLGHRMKGSGCSYGFPDVTVHGAAIEQAAKRQAAGEAEAAVARLEAYLRLVEIAGA